MKQTDKEALLRALYRYEAKASEVPDAANPGVSDKMEKKMKKIISSAGAPDGGKRAGKSLKIIAVAAAAAIALTAAVAANGEMRKKIGRFIMNLRGDSSPVYFEPDEPLKLKIEQCYLPQALPGGFTESIIKQDDAGTSACWTNEAGDRIVYDQGTRGSMFIVNCEGSELDYLTLGGKYKAVTYSGNSRAVIWYRDGYLMYLSVPLDISKEEMIAIAESVSPAEVQNY